MNDEIDAAFQEERCLMNAAAVLAGCTQPTEAEDAAVLSYAWASLAETWRKRARSARRRTRGEVDEPCVLTAAAANGTTATTTSDTSPR